MESYKKQNNQEDKQKNNQEDGIRNNQEKEPKNKFSKKKSSCSLFLILLSIMILGWLAYNNFKMQQSLKIINTKVNEINKPYDTLLNNVEGKIDGQIQQMLTNVLIEQKELVFQLSKDQILINEREGAKSLKTAEQYIKNKNNDMAKIYLFNAINHEPTNTKYVSELFNLIKKHYKTNPAVIQECRSILELSLFQFNSDDVAKSIKYIAELDKLELQNSIVETEIDWENEYNKLTETKPKNIIGSLEETKSYINNLAVILSNINDTGEQNKLTEKIQNELQSLQNLYNVSLIANEISTYINLLEKDKNYNSKLAVNRLLSAKSTATILWQQETSNLPTNFVKLIHQTIPEKLELIENKILEAKSKEPFDKAMTIAKDSKQKTKNLNSGIENYRKAIIEISPLFEKITYPEYQKQVLEKIKDLRNQITDCQRKQYVEYQKWVSDICLELLEKINNETAFTDKDAIKLFGESDFKMIDASSLSAENSRVYNNILQQFIGELPPKKAFDIEKVILEAKKKTMEDF